MGKNDVNQIADNVRVVHAGCGVNALSAYKRMKIQHVAIDFVDTVMACKFFPGPVSRIAGMPDTAPSGA
ncbi:hypothetical protein, partial [Escherichia coli]|uniref:hypothetical protein n=2 Tax=Escherichia coli TaxID=562 RepID=UPI001BD2969D